MIPWVCSCQGCEIKSHQWRSQIIELKVSEDKLTQGDHVITSMLKVRGLVMSHGSREMQVPAGGSIVSCNDCSHYTACFLPAKQC